MSAENLTNITELTQTIICQDVRMMYSDDFLTYLCEWQRNEHEVHLVGIDHLRPKASATLCFWRFACACHKGMPNGKRRR